MLKYPHIYGINKYFILYDIIIIGSHKPPTMYNVGCKPGTVTCVRTLGVA